jgi:hypothetical protein
MGRYTHRVQVFRYALAREATIFDRPPSIPSRWEGKKYRLSNDLFPLPTGGGEGAGDQFRPYPCPAPIACTRWCILGVTARVRTMMVLLGLCALRRAGRTCPVMPAWMPASRTQGRDAALTIPGTGFSPIHAPRHDQAKITECAVGPLGRSPASEARALRARDGRAAEAARRLTEITPQRLQGAQGRARRGLGAGGRAVAPGTRPAPRH